MLGSRVWATFTFLPGVVDTVAVVCWRACVTSSHHSHVTPSTTTSSSSSGTAGQRSRLTSPLSRDEPHYARTRSDVSCLSDWQFASAVVDTELHAHSHLTAFCPYYPGRPVPEETFFHSHPPCSSDILYQFPSSAMIHPLCSTYVLDSPFPQPLSRPSLD